MKWMSGMDELDFQINFQKITGRFPFQWQLRLYQDFLVGALPDVVDLPTGLGKTSAMAVWLLARAAGAPVARRLIYVVDRRVVVDQATDEARMLRDRLTSNLAQALGLEGRNLPISTLRGGRAGDREWMQDPSHPAIVVGTVDMIGSRLLFEGYGVKREVRPMEAAFLGCDSLLLLDEAHLSTALLATARSMADATISGGSAFPPPMRVIPLSATAGSGRRVFALEAEDRVDPIVSRRLKAVKRLRIEKVGKLDPGDMARRAWDMADAAGGTPRILVFVHRREMAGKLREAIEKESARRKVRTQPLLLVGGRRGRERDLAAEALRDHGFIAGAPAPRQVPAFLVATSAGEVGVDLDADAMLCDLVPWERMVQRLGRVNRRGDGAADVLALHAETETAKDADETVRREATCRLLEALPTMGDGVIDASPGAIFALRTLPGMSDRIAEASTPAPLRPELSRPLVEAWALTGVERHAGRPEPAPWLRGWVEEEAATEIVFRTLLPVRRGPAPDETVAVEQDVEAYMDAAPPHPSETLEVTRDEALRWLMARAAAQRGRGSRVDEGDEAASAEAPHPDDVIALTFDRAHALRRAWRLRDVLAVADEGRDARRAEAALRRSLADGLLLVDSRLGGLSQGLLDEKCDAAPATADMDESWRAVAADPAHADSRPMIAFRLRLVPHEGGGGLPPPWRRAIALDAALDSSGDVARLLEIWTWRDATGSEGARPLARRPQRLADHQQAVEAAARRIAAAVGLPAEEVEAIGMAARLHDEGKAAAIWQDAMGAPREGRPWAKTGAGGNGRALFGYRHEFGSLLRTQDRVPEGPMRDLILHLIAAHHGRARPLIAIDGCAPDADFDGGSPSRLEAAAGEAALRFARLQRRFGPWGLAFREAVLRAADWKASAEAEVEVRTTENVADG